MTNTRYSCVLSAVKERRPLVHHITNYVTVNDCANITLAIGGAPVMAHAHEEVAEMVGIANALVLNIGTLDPTQVEAMLIAGRAAKARNVPIILDPVGAGATRLRTEVAHRLIQALPIAVIKGNAGEIGTLAGSDAEVKGVDSASLSGDPREVVVSFAEQSGMTVVMSGATDIVSDGRRTLLIENGDPMMGKISGTGCMASSLIGTCSGVETDMVVASAAALSVFGIAGERAAVNTTGPGSFKFSLFDSVAAITPEDLIAFGKIRSG